MSFMERERGGEREKDPLSKEEGKHIWGKNTSGI